MKILRFSFISLLAGVLFLPASALAQTPAPIAASQVPTTVLVATVNIYNATIVSQSGRTINISFDLANREGIQPEVKYGVSLTQSTPDGQVIADEKVFDEVLTLGAGAQVRREITYVVPAQLSGTYDLWISSRSSRGLPFGSSLLGKVTFYPSTEGAVSIDPSSCYLTVQGDAKNTRYSQLQGVDIAATETIDAHCAIFNTTNRTVALTPSFSTHYRNMYGAAVSAVGGDTASVSLAPNEHKVVVFALPKAKDPQAYDVLLALSEGGRVVSNSVKFHYVLRGASATIQNVVWDKENYEKGDTATVSFSWAQSADSFFGARAEGTPLASPTVEMSVTDEKGVSCGAPIVKELVETGSPLLSLRVPIVETCPHPVLGVIIKDATHGVLATGHFRTVPAVATPVPMPSRSLGTIVLIALLVLLIIVCISSFIIKKKGASGGNDGVPPLGMMLFVLMIAGGMFGAAPPAHADTWTWGDPIPHAVYTGNIDKTSYVAGEAIAVTGSVERWNCGNAVTVDFNVNVNGVTVRGEPDPTYGPGIGASTMLFSGEVPSSGAPVSTTLSAPESLFAVSFGSFASWGIDTTGYTFHNILVNTGSGTPPADPAPVVTLTQSPSATVTLGTVGSISWDSTNSPTSCSITRDGTIIATGQPSSGTYDLGALISNTTLTVTCTNAGGSGSTSVSFTVTNPPILSVSPTNVAFGTVAVGEIKDSTAVNASYVTIKNIGGGVLNITSITPSAHFACVSGCTGTLDAGVSQVANIRLTAPSTPGALGESVRVNSNAGNQSVTVNGTIIPVITINPGPLDFGDVILKKFVDKALTINNNSSTITVPAGSISVAAPFSCASSCAYPSILPGGSASVMLRYAPTALGAQTGVGTLSTGIQNNTGNLQGNGVPPLFKLQEI